MKPLHLLIGLLVLLASSSCSDSIEEPIPGQGENAGSTDVYHDYVRQNPYPKADNELFLNPPPLIVPEQMKGAGEQLRFSLSRSVDFDTEETVTSKATAWCMYNPHRALESGDWYWRFRVIGADGVEQPWSETYRFTVTDDLPVSSPRWQNASSTTSPWGIRAFMPTSTNKPKRHAVHSPHIPNTSP